MSLLYAVLGLAIVLLVAWFVTIHVLRRMVAVKSRPGHDWLTVAFFHPYCNAGGGGERVLWVALQAFDDIESAGQMEFVIYTGDKDISSSQTFDHVEDRFGIILSENLKSKIKFVPVHKRHLLDPTKYPRFTMLGQSIGSMFLAWEAIRAYNPDIFVDTTGFAFSYPIAAGLARCKVMTYTHYPTITTDMLHRVTARVGTYNNQQDISSSKIKTFVKIVYYRFFAALYRWAGRFVDVCMVNSSWTQAHVASLWGNRVPITVVYPPCNTDNMTSLPLLGPGSEDEDAKEEEDEDEDVEDTENVDVIEDAQDGDDTTITRERSVLSVGQFRPEKDHMLQLKAFALLKSKHENMSGVKLIMIGGCRDEGDEQRVKELQAAAKELKVQDCVEFRTNVPFPDLVAALGTASVGLHTMWNEHFGIGVVEMMAAGMIPVAHNSGGPKADIVIPWEGQQTGFLASSAEEYAQALADALQLPTSRSVAMRIAARASVDRFSDKAFESAFFAAAISLVHNTVHSKKAVKA